MPDVRLHPLQGMRRPHKGRKVRRLRKAVQGLHLQEEIGGRLAALDPAMHHRPRLRAERGVPEPGDAAGGSRQCEHPASHNRQAG